MNELVVSLVSRAIARRINNFGFIRDDNHSGLFLFDGPIVKSRISISAFGKSPVMVTVHYGLGIEEASKFAIRAMKEFGGELFRSRAFQTTGTILMQFPLGSCLDWKPRWSLIYNEHRLEDLSENIIGGIGEIVVPLTESIVDSNSFYSFLSSDESYSRWIYTNGAIRAANLIFLSRLTRRDESETVRTLSIHRGLIAAGLGANIDVDSFVSNVVQYPINID